MRKLYVGCGLTNAPQDFIRMVEAVKAELRKEWEVLEFIGLTGGTAADVYRWDIQKCVAECDMFVAVCDYGSTGLGYEMATAVEKFEKPTLGLAHVDSRVTRIVTGIDHPAYSFERYHRLEHIAILVRQKAQKHFGL